jgi:hypothetical protein
MGRSPTGGDDLDAAVAGRYRLPLAEFLAARDRLVRWLRAAGDRQTAARVAAVRRPTVSVWAANRLRRCGP